MAQSTWFTDDIVNVIAGVERTCNVMLLASDQTPEHEAFAAGFRAALAALATSFGVVLPIDDVLPVKVYRNHAPVQITGR